MPIKQLGGLTAVQIGGISISVILMMFTMVFIVININMSSTSGSNAESPENAEQNPDVCETKTDCAPGFLCSRAGECFPGCDSSADCPTGEECISGQCATPQGTQSTSLIGTQWEDPNWIPVNGNYSDTVGTGYVRKFRGKIGDNVEMRFDLLESATDLCAPAGEKVLAFGEVKIQNDDGVGVEWNHLNNDSHSTDYEGWSCCWKRGENVEWNLKYLGDARHNPTYESGLKSVFTPEEAGQMLRRTIFSSRECPESPWETCPEGYNPYGDTGNQFCCKGKVSPLGGQCDGQACAQSTDDHQNAPWCSTSKNWKRDYCPEGLYPYGGADSQFCCSEEPGSNGTCYMTNYACANKTSDNQGKEWCETSYNYSPEYMTLQANTGEYCTDTELGVSCKSTQNPTKFEIRRWPNSESGYTRIQLKSPRTNQWCGISSASQGIVCDNPFPSKSNLFYVQNRSDGTQGIGVVMSDNNSILWCSGENGRQSVRCNRNNNANVNQWEKFRIQFSRGSRINNDTRPNPVVNR